MSTPAIPKSLFGSTLTAHVEGVWIREDVLIPVRGLVGADIPSRALICWKKEAKLVKDAHK